MHEIVYKPGSIFPRLVLAADARRTSTLFTDDQIWELVIDRGEPLSLSVETSFGLRARNFRIFPRFTSEGRSFTDPVEFATPLKVRPIGPGYVQLLAQVLPSIELIYDVWVSSSQTICGSLQFRNTGKITQVFSVEIAAVLSLLSTTTPGSERMTIQAQDNKPVLAGSTGDFAPLVVLPNGSGSSASPYPSLRQSLELTPGQAQRVQWAHAAAETIEESFALAQKTFSRNWDAEFSRQAMDNLGAIEILTGDPAWDAAFDRARLIAFRLLQSPNNFSDNHYFVTSRQPDHGYSIRGDGSDYGPLWSGQTPLQAYYLSSFFFPTAPHLASGLLKNFLDAQKEDGSIDYRIGSAGYGSSSRSLLNATPVLARLAWQHYMTFSDRQFLKAVLPGLFQFFESWFSPERDKDGDGVPEWSSPVQSGLEDHPIYAHWLDGAPGLDITTVESPDLGAFLFSEAQALVQIAKLLDRKDIVRQAKKRMRTLKAAVDKCYHAQTGMYRTRDRETHLISQTQHLGSRVGPGEIRIDRHFLPAVRLCLTIRSSDGTLRRPVVKIQGAAVPNGENEEVLAIENFRWRPGTGHTTSQHIFIQVDSVSIEGMGAQDTVDLDTADHTIEDLTGLLPLWAGIPDSKRARSIAKQTIQEPARFGRPFGLPTSSLPENVASDASYHTVHLPWNMLILEGLLAYDQREAAATIFQRIMQAVCDNLEREGCFRRFYHADSGQGIGEADALEGLPPLGLFLEILGVKLLGDQQLILSGRNPFPWPVTVKFRGTTILRQMEKTTIIFPNGQTATLTDSRPHLIHIG